VKLVDAPEMAEWLATQPPCQWDAGNLGKLSKHGMDAADVNTLHLSPVVFAGEIAEPFYGETRYLLLAQLLSGKQVAMVFTRRGEELRPISVRAMRKNERRIYAQATGH